MSQQSELHWYALRVAPQRERVARFFLEQQGVEAFVPVETRFRRVNRYAKRKTEQEFCIMPGYLFAGFPRQEGAAAVPWSVLNRIPHVKGVIGYHERPWRLDDRKDGGVFTTFMAVHRNGKLKAPGYERFMATGREFEPGELVDINAGAYRDYRVRVLSITGHMATILLPLFGQKEMPAQVPLEYLDAAE